MFNVASVNEVHIIGKVIGNPEQLRTVDGKPYLHMVVETERVMILASKERRRIVHKHSVVIRKQSDMEAMRTYAKPGVFVRVSGELNYDPRPEIVVWEFQGFARLMAVPTVMDKEPAPVQPQAHAPAPLKPPVAASGGAGGFKVRPKAPASAPVEEHAPHMDNHDDDDRDPVARIMDSSSNTGDASWADEIPF